MIKKISPRTTLLSLGLALLLSGWTACKGAPDKTDNTAAGAAKAPAGATAGTPSTAAPGAAAPGAAGSPATIPGHANSNLPGAPVQPAMSAEKIPAVVARVNGKEIRKAELLEGAQVVQMRLAQAGQPVNPTADFYHHVLNEIVAITLLQQEAKAQGFTATDEEVQRIIAARKQSFPSEQAYKQALAQAGITEERLREQARETISVQKYVQTKLAPQAAVPDQAVKDFYEKNKAEMKVPERLHLRHILILAGGPKATPADREKAKQKAQDVLKRAQAGEDFAKLAQEFSDDPGSKSRGGDVGLLARGQTVPVFEQAAFALTKPNQLSPVIEVNSGYDVIQLVERKEPSVVPFEQVKDRITGMLKQQQVQKLFQVRADQLRAKGKVETFI